MYIYMFMHTMLHGLYGKYIKRTTRHNNFNFPFIKFFKDCKPAGLYCKLLNPNHFQAGMPGSCLPGSKGCSGLQ